MSLFTSPRPSLASALVLFSALLLAPALAVEVRVDVHDHGGTLHSEKRFESGVVPLDWKKFIESGAAAFKKEDGYCSLVDSRPRTIPDNSVEPYEVPETFLVRMQYKRGSSQKDINSRFMAQMRQAMTTEVLTVASKKMSEELKDSRLSAMKIAPRSGGGGVLKFFGGATKMGFDFKDGDIPLASMTLAPLEFLEDNTCKVKFHCAGDQLCKCLVTRLVLEVQTDSFNPAVQNVIMEQWLEDLSILAWQAGEKDFTLAEWVRVEPKKAQQLPKGAMPMPWGPVFWMAPKGGRPGSLRNCASNVVLKALGIKAQQTVPRGALDEEDDHHAGRLESGAESVDEGGEAEAGAESLEEDGEAKGAESSEEGDRLGSRVVGANAEDDDEPTRNSSPRLVRMAK